MPTRRLRTQKEKLKEEMHKIIVINKKQKNHFIVDKIIKLC